MWLLKFLLYVLSINCCTGFTVYYEVGTNACIKFNRTIQNLSIEYIARNSSNICYSSTGVSITPIPNGWKNRTFKCELKNEIMSVCFNETQRQDAANFTHRIGLVDYETKVLEIASPPVVHSLKNSSTVEGINFSQKCQYDVGKPPKTFVYWTRLSDKNFNQTGDTLHLTNIQRTSSDTYTCTAGNIYSSGNKGQHSQSMVINVQYKPEVNTDIPSPYRVKEGHVATLRCRVSDANPNTNITWKWSKEDNPNDINHTDSTYRINNIQKTQSGKYNCAASNTIGMSLPATVQVDVQYKPNVETTISSPYKVVEGAVATLRCGVINANPNTNITWYWNKTDNPNIILHTDSTYRISSIQRTQSGTYKCTASNAVGMSLPATVQVDVEYPPTVSNLTEQKIIEGKDLTVRCNFTFGNPSKTNVFWTGDSGFQQNNVTLQLKEIQRKSAGTYKCIAKNKYSSGGTGTSSQCMDVNVLYPPEILEGKTFITNESQPITLIRNISSNPFSNVYWFKGIDQVFSQKMVTSAMYTIKGAQCTDTGNYTLVATNGITNNASAQVELLVNCKPITEGNLTLGITDEIGIEFSINVIAYPQPNHKLNHINKTDASEMTSEFFVNGVNNFTIKYNQTAVTPSDYGIYVLEIENAFGKSHIYVDVIPRRKPNPPEVISVICYVESAEVTWKSTFNGGTAQTFTAIATMNGQYEASRSSPIEDKGENEVHMVSIYGLQPSVTYIFNVSAKNSHGKTLSKPGLSCRTKEKEEANSAMIAAGAAAGGISLAVISIVLVIVFRRYRGLGKQAAAKSKRLEHDVADNDSENDDGLKDNVLYVPAGPRDYKLGTSDVAEYAEVNKKGSGSDSNANVYAEVKKQDVRPLYTDVKPKKGLFKKGEKTKQKKGRKQKPERDGQDVYENSEDIALEQKKDENVYSNATDKCQSKKNDQRGYKNQDGLLYVEVQFEAKSENGKPIIHGEEEKTDYATVEFP